MKVNIHPHQPPRRQAAERGGVAGDGFEMSFAGATDVGICRAVNQDAYLLAPEHGLFVVADGMGGHAAGEVASLLTSELIGAYFEETADMEAEEMPMPYDLSDDMMAAERRLVTAVKLANTAVYEQSVEIREQRGMGTTVVAVHAEEDMMFWAHVGDSRLYRLREGRLIQLTSDHSLLNHAIEQRGLRGEELREFVEHFPYKNVLVRAVGVRPEVEVEYGHVYLEPGDVFLLCTDGAHNLLETQDMRAILQDFRGDLQACCNEIVRESNRRGGPDNITAVVLEARSSLPGKALH